MAVAHRRRFEKVSSPAASCFIVAWRLTYSLNLHDSNVQEVARAAQALDFDCAAHANFGLSAVLYISVLRSSHLIVPIAHWSLHKMSANTADSSRQVGKLDLSARAIDLTTALLRATTSSGSLLKGAWEIGQWLGRERLNQYELLDCMQKAKGLVLANQQGQQFFDKVINGLESFPVKPLFLEQSGSLGRLMAGDPHLSWIVSTVAALFQHHRDDRYVTETLTAFIMESHRTRDQEQAIVTRDAFTYDPEQTRVRAVVRKIVSSVWYNVVNVGCDTIPLPQELLSLCERGHYLDPVDFAIVANSIYAKCPSKAILRTDHLLRDVLLWLLLHYDGTVVVNVGGHIVYTADFGNPHRELEVHIPSACSAGSNCAASGHESYRILHHVSGSFEEFLSGHSFSEVTELSPRPGIRQQLYDIPRMYPEDNEMRNKVLQILTKSSAKAIMHWLLGVSLSPQINSSSPGFSAQLGQRATQDHITISLALKRVPAMINQQWGDLLASPAIFVDCFETLTSPDNSDQEAWNIERRMIIVLEYFPVLVDLMKRMSTNCSCLDCSGQDNRSKGQLRDQRYRSDSLKLGCLKRTALEEVLLLLAHGVADGFGVTDASSVLDTKPIVEGMVTLLLELVIKREVSWNTWFMVASCVYLGCPFERSVPYTHPSFDGTAFAAIQYGNLVTQAPWLDLTQDLDLRGCFGLVGSSGRLGVATESDDQHTQFRSVEENFAIIETENTEDTSPFCSRYKKPLSLVDHRTRLDEDECSIESDVILCQMDDRFYRLLLRIKTRTHRRVVDPSDALSSIIRMLPSAFCEHGTEPPPIPPVSAKIYTMDEIVGRWPDVVQAMPTTTESDDTTRNGGIIHLTEILNTNLKKNIALALSVCPVAVPNHPERTCTTCTVEHARKAARKSLREGEGGNAEDRYVVNIRIREEERSGSTRRRLKEGPNTSAHT